MGVVMPPKEAFSRKLERGSFAFAASRGEVCCDSWLLEQLLLCRQTQEWDLFCVK